MNIILIPFLKCMCLDHFDTSPWFVYYSPISCIVTPSSVRYLLSTQSFSSAVSKHLPLSRLETTHFSALFALPPQPLILSPISWHTYQSFSFIRLLAISITVPIAGGVSVPRSCSFIVFLIFGMRLECKGFDGSWFNLRFCRNMHHFMVK